VFNNSGLSLEQAPPIKVILRFFLTGAIFGVVASIMLFFWHDNLNIFSSPTTLAFVHTLTLGVMASFMLGALFQMMPVICGVHIKAPINTSVRVNYALIFGVVFLISYFLIGSNALLYFSLFLLGFALFATSYMMIKELSKIKHSNSSRGMLLALIGLVATVVFAILLLLVRAGVDINLNYLTLKSIHYNFGLFSWISMLVISVSFQVIEMFYVTPKYQDSYSKYITLVIFALLIIYAINSLWGVNFTDLIIKAIAIALLAHSIYTLINIKKKKRPVNDASIWFWIVSMVSLGGFSLSLFFGGSAIFSGILFTTFSLSVVFAMSYKIVPFLVWFHLNAQGYFDAPMMHEVISPKYAKYNFWFFLIASFLTILSLFYTKIYYFATFFWLITFFMLLLSIYRAWHKYLHTLKHGKKMSFNFN